MLYRSLSHKYDWKSVNNYLPSTPATITVRLECQIQNSIRRYSVPFRINTTGKVWIILFDSPHLHVNRGGVDVPSLNSIRRCSVPFCTNTTGKIWILSFYPPSYPLMAGLTEFCIFDWQSVLKDNYKYQTNSLRCLKLHNLKTFLLRKTHEQPLYWRYTKIGFFRFNIHTCHIKY